MNIGRLNGKAMLDNGRRASREICIRTEISQLASEVTYPGEVICMANGT